MQERYAIHRYHYEKFNQEVDMYSVSASLFVIFSLVVIGIQLFLSQLSYDYPQTGFIIITIVSLLFAFYFFILDYQDRKNSRGKR